MEEQVSMDISDYTDLEQIKLDLSGNNKEEVLKELVKVLKLNQKIISESKFYEALLKREAEGSTGLGRGIAIPHGKSETVKELSLVVGRSKQGIDFASLAGGEVKLIFMIADFPGVSEEYLELLAKLTASLRNDKLRQRLLDAKDKQEILSILNKF